MRIILSKSEIKGDKASLSGEKARYLISVMRCGAGENLQVLDGEGGCYEARISGIDSKKVSIELLRRVSHDTESPLNLVLVQGILKGEKMDWVIQKASELGVKEIIPAITERGQVRETRKAARWRKIGEEASRQSGRTEILMVHDPIDFGALFIRGVIARSKTPSPVIARDEVPKQSYDRLGAGSATFSSEIASPEPALSDKTRLLRSARNDKSEGARNDGINGFIFWEEGGLPLKEAVKMGIGGWGLGISSFTKPQSLNSDPSLFIAIGPEGGFTKKEVELANSKGLLTVSLGKRILRAETAAISAITLVQFLAGDI